MPIPHTIFNLASPLTSVQIDLLLINNFMFVYIHVGLHKSNGSVRQEGYKYFLNAVGLFPWQTELPASLNLRTTFISFFSICWIYKCTDGWRFIFVIFVIIFTVPSTTYKSVLELEIIKEIDPTSGLCYTRFYSKEKT